MKFGSASLPQPPFFLMSLKFCLCFTFWSAPWPLVLVRYPLKGVKADKGLQWLRRTYYSHDDKYLMRDSPHDASNINWSSIFAIVCTQFNRQTQTLSCQCARDKRKSYYQDKKDLSTWKIFFLIWNYPLLFFPWHLQAIHDNVYGFTKPLNRATTFNIQLCCKALTLKHVSPIIWFLLIFLM